MSWTDGKRRAATKEDCEVKWGGRKENGFRCYLCGHPFMPGDLWRFQYSQKTINFLVCAECDGPDVVKRFEDRVNEFSGPKFWALRNDTR